jgi:N-methylhydantoinase A
MAASGVDLDEVVIERAASMRYAGQKLQELIIRLPDGPVDAELCAEMERRFTTEYTRLYSPAALALFQNIEIFNLRVTARVPAKASVGNIVAAQGPLPERHEREVHWPGHGRRATAVYVGAVRPGTEVTGPAIVELEHTSVAVAPGQRLTAEPDGTLVLLLT